MNVVIKGTGRDKLWGGGGGGGGGGQTFDPNRPEFQAKTVEMLPVYHSDSSRATALGEIPTENQSLRWTCWLRRVVFRRLPISKSCEPFFLFFFFLLITSVVLGYC